MTKTENIFLDKDFNLKIGDFGFAKYVDEKSKSDKLLRVNIAFVSLLILRNFAYASFNLGKFENLNIK